MASSINASTTAGVVTTADTSGVLNIQTAGTTAISIDASQAVTMAGRTSNPTTISVGGATPSASGAGITFPATQSASSDANTLDDYEEGTYTVTYSGSTGSAGSIAYSTNSGIYTKVGRLVTAQSYIQLSNVGSWTGSVQLSLPFTATSQYFQGAVSLSGVTFTERYAVLQVVTASAIANVILVTTNTSGAALPCSAVDATDSILFNVTYFV